MTPNLPNLSQIDYSRFRELVRQKSGLRLADYRLSDLTDALSELARQTGLSEPNALYELLCRQDSPSRAALEQFIGALTVGESYFFRNRPQFDALEQKILPQIIERQQNVKRLRIWSAGCSTGEEPYSVAILLKRFPPDIARWKVLILATDINRQALQKAQQGLYRNWSLRQLSSQLQAHYFTTDENFNQEIRHDIRQMVSFSYLNLIEESYPSLLNNTSGMDLILCRNVLIYFDPEVTPQVVGRLYNSLGDDGWLLVGHAEPSQNIFHQFQTHYFPGTIIYQKVYQNSSPATVLAPASPLTSISTPFSPASAFSEPPASAEEEQQSEGQSLEFNEAYRLAKLYANQQELKKANALLKIVLEQAPLLARAHYLQGVIYSEWGQLDNALAAFRRAAFAEPQFILAHFALATLFGRKGQPKRAQKLFNKVTQLLASLSPDAPISEEDEITAKELLEMVTIQQGLIRLG